MGTAAATKQTGDYSSVDLKIIKRRFMALNDERLSRVYKSLSRRQKNFLDILPLVFHNNIESLPGYVASTPTGISDYVPSNSTIAAAKSLASEYKGRRAPMHVYNIYSLFMMGSSGTVAYSEKSDFDIWIVHRPGLSPDDVDKLQLKCNLLNKWADTLGGLEANFFVMSSDTLRKGEFEALSEDSSGTAQHMLLMEEFYRTGLLIAGRYPAWWIIPPDRSIDYDVHLKKLIDTREVYDHEYVDFGNVIEIPADEFFGATVWQLHKAINSPYKSVLKLLLMESYAAEYPKTDLLCTIYKRAIYEGETNVDKLDPYVLMSKKAEAYLVNQGADERLELARRCFYFKVHENLSEKGRKKDEKRREIMMDLTDGWGWDQEHLVMLDSRENWKIDKVLEERKNLTEELTTSYRILSDFARKHSQESNINPADLNILGRRLYAAIERKAGKVELINPGISVDLTEKRIAIVQSFSNDNEVWSLYREDIETASANKTPPIKRTNSIIELIAWCHFNDIIGRQTMLTLHVKDGDMTSKELFSIIESFKKLFPESNMPHTDMTLLKDPSRVITPALYINLGTDPFSHHSRMGLHLTSSRSDAFSYGGEWKNILLSCEILIVTSWGEVLTFRYDGETALLDCICDYFAWAPMSEKHESPPVHIYCYSSKHGPQIEERINRLLKDMAALFYKSKYKNDLRYVLRVERDFYIIQAENDTPRYTKKLIGNELYMALGEPHESFSPIVLDRYLFEQKDLATIIKKNLPDIIQLFIRADGEQSHVYILDEKGSLFYQVTSNEDNTFLITQFRRFLESAINRRNMIQTETDSSMGTQLECYQIIISSSGKQGLKIITPQQGDVLKKYFGIQVIGDAMDEKHSKLTLFCDGQEFSTLEYGENLFKEVAKYVIQRRKGGERYPIYITDIDVSSAFLGLDGKHKPQTIHFLNHKKLIETKLNNAMHSL